jgi:hypothetical protein
MVLGDKEMLPPSECGLGGLAAMGICGYTGKPLKFVILSAAKNLLVWRMRFFAALRMTILLFRCPQEEP